MGMEGSVCRVALELTLPSSSLVLNLNYVFVKSVMLSKFDASSRYSYQNITDSWGIGISSVSMILVIIN